jgi:hypothetical protein
MSSLPETEDTEVSKESLQEETGTRSIQKRHNTEQGILEEYRDKLLLRKIQALEKILEIDEFPETKTEVLEQLGVPRTTWHMWTKDSVFVSALNKILEIRRIDDCFVVENTIRKGVRAKDYKWIKLWLTLQGLDKKDSSPGESERPSFRLEVYEDFE